MTSALEYWKKYINKTYVYADIFLKISFNCPCNLTRRQRRDFDVISMTQFLNSNVNYEGGLISFAST